MRPEPEGMGQDDLTWDAYERCVVGCYLAVEEAAAAFYAVAVLTSEFAFSQKTHSRNSVYLTDLCIPFIHPS